MNRYFLAFSYVGYNFKASVKTAKTSDTNTVAGALELAVLSSQHVKKTSPIYISSRTDAGVHALHNTAHIDIEWRESVSFNLETVKKNLNKFFLKRNLSLWVFDIIPVSQNFSARYCAQKRVYMYRFAVNKSSNCHEISVPGLEFRRCHFVHSKNFDVGALQEALSVFPGIKDFRNFIKGSDNQNRSPIRFLQSCSLNQGRSLLDSSFDPAVDNYSFWNVNFEGKSFGYQQIRRMLSAAVAVAEGKLSITDLQHMLDFPLTSQSVCLTSILPAYGLYLTKVVYDPEDFSLHRLQRPHPYRQLLNIIEKHKSQLSLQPPSTTQHELLEGVV